LALERYRELQPYLENGVSLANVAQAASLSLRTAARRVIRNRRFGLAGLIRRTRGDSDKRHSLAPGKA
jgi:hypothetical protein